MTESKYNNLESIISDIKYYCNRKNAIWAYRLVKMAIEKAAWIQAVMGTDMLTPLTKEIDQIMVDTEMKEKIKRLYRLDKSAKGGSVFE